MATESHPNLPDFLIVGGMKCGSSTVFADLATQPQIFVPVHKEPHDLCSDEVLSERGRARYARLFEKAGADQLCGEGSTGYTKLPVYPDVPQRAREVIGPDLRIIYSVREPVARAISHHRHLYLEGTATSDFERTLGEIPDLINFSRYAMQIEPWIEVFGRQNVHIIQLEEYSRNRRRGLCELCKFLGFEGQPDLVQQDIVFRAADSKQKIPSWIAEPVRRVTWSRWYKYYVRPAIPDFVVSQVKRTLLSSPPPPPRPSLAVVNRIIDRVRDDTERLQQLTCHDEPLWDFDAVRAKFVGDDRAAAPATELG